MKLKNNNNVHTSLTNVYFAPTAICCYYYRNKKYFANTFIHIANSFPKTQTISDSIISSDNKVYTYMYSYHILFHTAIYLINCKLIEEIDYYLMYSHPTGMNLVD